MQRTMSPESASPEEGVEDLLLRGPKKRRLGEAGVKGMLISWHMDVQVEMKMLCKEIDSSFFERGMNKMSSDMYMFVSDLEKRFLTAGIVKQWVHGVTRQSSPAVAFRFNPVNSHFAEEFSLLVVRRE